jgi:hypothetical protein
LGDEAFTPLPDGVAVTAQLGRDLLVGRLVRLGGAQDDAATKDERLRGGACADQGFELATQFGCQFDSRGKRARHDGPPDKQDKSFSLENIMATDAPLG